MMVPDISKGKKIDFKVLKEDWNEYDLDDGTKLKVKTVLIDVIRMPEYNQLGEPIYHLMSQNVVKLASVPKELKKEMKPSTTPIT